MSQSSWHWKANITCGKTFHKKITSQSQSSWHWKANITDNSENSLFIIKGSQSSWHWKANITAIACAVDSHGFFVAILMTLEGEYYFPCLCSNLIWISRNPHDIGRRILRKIWRTLLVGLSRNPHDIGRRILLAEKYKMPELFESRNPHDIGRRILQDITYRCCSTCGSRNPHDIGRRILPDYKESNRPL